MTSISESSHVDRQTNANDHWLSETFSESQIDSLYPSVLSADTKKEQANWENGFSFAWQDSKLTRGFRHSMVDIDDEISLSVEVGGNPNNPPILLIMGLGSQMVFWSDSFVYRLIKAGFFVIRFDNRDIGLSSKIQSETKLKVNRLKMMLKMQVGIANDEMPVSYTLKDMAEDTAKLIESLRLTKVTVMGASMGGIIAQLLAYRHQQLISHLVLLFTTTNRALLPPPKPKQLYTLFKRPASQAKESIITHGVWFIKTVGSPGFLDIEKVSRVSKIRYERNYYPLGTIQQLNAILATGSITKFSKRIQASTLVLSGDEDGLVPASHGRDVANSIPNADFHLIEGMGHDLVDYYQPFIVDKIVKHCFG